jgi:hypothetical protein
MQHKPVAVDDRTKPDGVSVAGSIKPDVEVTDDKQRVAQCRHGVENGSEVIEEGWLHYL